MPIIIQETSVQMVPPQEAQPAEATRGAAGPGAQSAVVPLRPTDVELMQRYLNARRARLHAD